MSPVCDPGTAKTLSSIAFDVANHLKKKKEEAKPGLERRHYVTRIEG